MRKSAGNTTSYNVLKKTKLWKYTGEKRKYEKSHFVLIVFPFKQHISMLETHFNAGNTRVIRLLFTAGYYSTGPCLGCLYLI